MLKSKRIIRTERIWIKKELMLKILTHISKNLYNEANYIIRQTYFNENKWIRFTEVQQALKESENYQQLPTSTALKILKIMDNNWKLFFKLHADWEQNPKKYFKEPKIPKYKMKSGTFLLPFSKPSL